MLNPIRPAIQSVSAGTTRVTSGELVFSNSNGVTFGINGQTLTASAAGGGGSVNFSAGTTSNTLTAITFSNANGVSFGLASNGTITATVKTDYLTTAMASNRGTDFVQATAGFNGTNCSGTIASNSISVSVGNYITTARGSTDAIGLNTAKTNVTWTVNSSGLSLDAGGYAGTGFTSTTTTGTNIVGTHNTAGLSLGVPAMLTTADLSQNSSKYVQNWKLTGNTAGTTSSAQGTDLWISGGNSITVSGNSNTIVLSVGAYLTTAALSGDTSKYVQAWELTGNTAGTTSSLQGTKLYFDGGNSITVSGNSNTIRLSVGAYITTADLSQNSSKYVQNWKLTGNTAGTTSSAQGTDLWFSGGNSITVSGSSNSIVFSVGNYLTTAMASNRGTDFVQATAGFNGTNCSGTIASNSISVSVSAQSNQTVGAYFSGNTTISSSGTRDARSLSISGAGAVTVGYDTAASQIVISGATAAAGSLSFYASSNTTGTSSGTGAGSISVAGAGAISIAASNSGFVVSAPATSSLSATGWASISTNGSTISIGASTTMNLYASSNTFGTSSGTADMRSISIAGSGNCSVAASNSGWVVSVPAQTNQSGNVYAASNTFGTSSGTYDARTISLAGSGQCSIAASNSGFVVSVPFSRFITRFMARAPSNGK
jgi:hypothetical protein